MEQGKKLSLWTLIFLIVVPTFGFGNITNNVVALGAASIPSWIIVAILFFLPLSLMIAELASVSDKQGGGIYTWINHGLGANWAFIGSWSYFIANLFYLQMVFARIPVLISWTIFGENRFIDTPAYLVPLLSIIVAVVFTFIASVGVKTFSKISDIGGMFTLISVAVFVVFAIVGVAAGHQPATPLSTETMMPVFDVTYFATFAWLLFSFAGAEIGGTYVNEINNPKRTLPKAILTATMFVALAYILGSIAVLLVASPETIQEAGIKDSQYLVFKMLADQFGLNGDIIVKVYCGFLTIASSAAYILWMESPLRVIFSEVPEGTFPKVLTKKDDKGILKNALWIQLVAIIVLICIPMIGIESIDTFFNMLMDLSALALIPPYIILTAGYLVFRMKRSNDGKYTDMFKSRTLAIVAAVVTFILSVVAYTGAGFDYMVSDGTAVEKFTALAKVYAGPIILIGVGFILRWASQKSHARKK